MDWCTVDSIYCIKNSINYCTSLIITPIWSPFCARNWCIWSCHWCSSVHSMHPQRVPHFYQLHSTAKNWMQQSKSTQCMTMKMQPSYRHAANGTATWSTKRLWYTQTTNLFSTCKHNPSSMPARCIGWILWLTTGWIFAIGQARPTLFQIPCQGHHAAPLWRHWGWPKLLLWAVLVHCRLLANRPLGQSWSHWSGWAPLSLSPNGWDKCMRQTDPSDSEMVKL